MKRRENTNALAARLTFRRASARLTRSRAPGLHGGGAKRPIFRNFNGSAAKRAKRREAPDFSPIHRSRLNFTRPPPRSGARRKQPPHRKAGKKRKNRFSSDAGHILLLTNKILGVSYLTRINELFIILSNLNS